MRYGVINPRDVKAYFIDADDFETALKAAGLDVRGVDHGNITRAIAIVVNQFSLYDRPQWYFSIGRAMYGGPALLYAVDHVGETIDMPPTFPPIVYYRSDEEVERMIQRDVIDRPCMRWNGELMWQWPDPKPDLEAIIKKGMT